MIWRYVREDEIYEVLKACHGEPRGGHFTDNETTHKVLHMEYYLPNVLWDEKKCVEWW